MADNLNTKKWPVQTKFINFVVDLANQLGPNDPQHVNLVKSLFDFLSNSTNREFLTEGKALREVLLTKILNAYTNPKNRYDSIKDSIDRLYDIIMEIG